MGGCGQHMGSRVPEVGSVLHAVLIPSVAALDQAVQQIRLLRC